MTVDFLGPKTSSEVELMETFPLKGPIASPVVPKTSSEVELLETGKKV